MPDELKVRRRKITDYVPDPHNLNAGTERGQYMLDHSVEEVGLARSIVAAADDTIPAGNKTLQAAVDAGFEDVIEVEVDGHELVVVKRKDWPSVNSRQARLYSALDNRTSEVGLNWNPIALAALMQDKVGLDEGEAPVDFGGMWREDELKRIFDDIPPQAWPEYDESIVDTVEWHECPNCGHKWPK